MLWTAAGLTVVGALVVALAPTAPVLALGVVVAGSAAGAASPALVVAISTTSPGRLVDRRQSVVNAGAGVGVAAVGAVALLAPAAWRPVWVGAAVAAVVTAAVVDRHTAWPSPTRPATGPATSPATGPSPVREAGPGSSLVRPVAAAALAGVGSAAVWTFGRDLLGAVGGLAGDTTAVLWVLLGVAAVLGAVGGDAARLLGLRRAWTVTVLLTAAGTGVLPLTAAEPVAAGVALAVFGGSYTALSGVLITWAATLRPLRAGETTATLFVALTAGQAVGSVLTGALSTALDPVVSFGVCAGLLALAGAARPTRHPPGDGHAARGERHRVDDPAHRHPRWVSPVITARRARDDV